MGVRPPSERESKPVMRSVILLSLALTLGLAGTSSDADQTPLQIRMDRPLAYSGSRTVTSTVLRAKGFLYVLTGVRVGLYRFRVILDGRELQERTLEWDSDQLGTAYMDVFPGSWQAAEPGEHKISVAVMQHTSFDASDGDEETMVAEATHVVTVTPGAPSQEQVVMGWPWGRPVTHASLRRNGIRYLATALSGDGVYRLKVSLGGEELHSQDMQRNDVPWNADEGFRAARSDTIPWPSHVGEGAHELVAVLERGMSTDTTSPLLVVATATDTINVVADESSRELEDSHESIRATQGAPEERPTWVLDRDWCGRSVHHNATCTLGGHRLLGAGLPERLDSPTVCSELARKGVRRIAVVGDSYARHINVALKLILSNNYDSGALPRAALEDLDTLDTLNVCHGASQFSARECRGLVSGRVASLCGGDVEVSMCSHHGLESPMDDECGGIEEAQVIVWGIGRHHYGPLRDKVFCSSQNASLLNDLFFRPLCSTRIRRALMARRLLFVTDHFQLSTDLDFLTGRYRGLVAWSEGEQGGELMRRYREWCVRPDEVAAFGEEAEEYAKSVCGAKVFNPYPLTRALALQLPEEAARLTYDGRHWGLQLNCVFAHVILDAL